MWWKIIPNILSLSLELLKIEMYTRSNNQPRFKFSKAYFFSNLNTIIYPKLCSFRWFWKLQLADCGFELFNYWWKLSREITYFSPIFFPFYFFLWSISSSFILWLNKEFFDRSWWLMFALDYIETKVSQYYSLFCFNINTERWSHWQNYCLWIFEFNHPNSINLRVNFIHITQLTRTSNSVTGNQTGLWVVAASHHFDVLLCHTRTHQTTEFSISEISFSCGCSGCWIISHWLQNCIFWILIFFSYIFWVDDYCVSQIPSNHYKFFK